MRIELRAKVLCGCSGMPNRTECTECRGLLLRSLFKGTLWKQSWLTASSCCTFGSTMAFTPKPHFLCFVHNQWLNIVGLLCMDPACLMRDSSNAQHWLGNSPLASLWLSQNCCMVLSSPHPVHLPSLYPFMGVSPEFLSEGISCPLLLLSFSFIPHRHFQTNLGISNSILVSFTEDSNSPT